MNPSSKLQSNTHTVGIVLVLASVIAFSFGGVFTKAVEAGAWEIIFWRGVFAAAFTTAYVAWRGSLKTEFTLMGWSGLAAAAIGASGTAAFIPAFKLTTMANVLMIYAAAPLVAATLAWLWVGERMTWKLVLACVAAFVGVLIIVTGSATSVSFSASGFKGDLLALWMTISMAVMMVVYRRWPNTPAAGPAALSSVFLLPIALIFSNPFSMAFNEIIITAGFGLTFSIASVTLAEGVRRISAGETALLSVLETPIAPLLGWLFFREMPLLATWIGGGLIFAAVLASQLKKKDFRND